MERNIVHGSFTVERTFDTPVAQVYAAFADKTSKEKWFKGPDGAQSEHTMDFRPSGRESNSGAFHGAIHRFEATYYDIVPKERIVYAYEMYLNDKRISVSLTTITFEDIDGHTRLQLHEDGVFLDGLDGPEIREQGTNGLLEALAATL